MILFLIIQSCICITDSLVSGNVKNTLTLLSSDDSSSHEMAMGPIDCWTQDLETLICSWAPIPGAFRYSYTHKLWESKEVFGNVSQPQLQISEIISFGQYNVSVQAFGPWGGTNKAHTVVDVETVVIPYPPQLVNVQAIKDKPDTLSVFLSYSYFEYVGNDLYYQVSAKTLDGLPDTILFNSTAKSLMDTDKEYSLNVTNLKPYTWYALQVRAHFQPSTRPGSWSSWSSIKNSRTSHAPPLYGPHLWREFIQPLTPPHCRARLLWLPLDPTEARGKTIAYHITKKHDSVSSSTKLPVHVSFTKENSAAALPKVEESQPVPTLETVMTSSWELGKLLGPINITMEMETTAGRSPTSFVNIPGCPAPSPARVDNIVGNGSRLLISWVDLSSEVPNSYIVQWREIDYEKIEGNRDGNVGVKGTQREDFGWMQVPANANHLWLDSVSGLREGQQYEIRVFARHRRFDSLVYEALAYLEEEAPVVSPKVSLLDVTQNSLQLLIEPVDVKFCRGFLSGFQLLLEGAGTKERETVTHHGRVDLTLSTPGTSYNLTVWAETAGGLGPSTILTFKSRPAKRGTILYIMLPIIVVAVLVILLKTFSYKTPRIRDKIWPSIPEPSLSLPISTCQPLSSAKPSVEVPCQVSVQDFNCNPNSSPNHSLPGLLYNSCSPSLSHRLSFTDSLSYSSLIQIPNSLTEASIISPLASPMHRSSLELEYIDCSLVWSKEQVTNEGMNSE
uniref:Fibronectin type-III domain-containing protein n=1 Tax=Eptatretus burgeri TaxID=7764 RepID=A0A8C4QAC1_EPTBU